VWSCYPDDPGAQWALGQSFAVCLV
jgi:hypothetical protein